MSTYWQTSVYYGQYSSNHSNAEDEAEARVRLAEDVVYLRSVGREPKRATIQWFCFQCSGQGTIWVPNKKTRAVGKNVPCPMCLGMNPKGEVIEVAL